MCHGHCGGCMVHKISRGLLIVGGLNWGLYGIGMLMGSNWNVVNLLLGSWPTVEYIVYILVGVSAVAEIFGCKCSKCKEACATCMADSKMEGGMEGKM
jgi:uncharacterized membrane protein YuzA (DUF378 family)